MMLSNANKITNKRMRYTRQAIISNTFLQLPRFLFAGEFENDKISNNARILYALLHDRHRVSIKSGWFDENGEAYIYFKREEMEKRLGLSERTVTKVMQELKDFQLVEEKKQGMNRPNKIYLLAPIIGDGEPPEAYLDPEADDNPETTPDNDYMTEPEISAPRNPQNLRPPTRKTYASEPVDSAPPKPQDLRPNNNKINNNHTNDNKGSDTTAACGGAGVGSEAPHKEIMELYNHLCKTRELRPIHAIDGKRKRQTATFYKLHGLDGFITLFEKVAASDFLCGGGGRGWKTDFDWLIDPTNAEKVITGKYDNDRHPLPTTEQGIFITPASDNGSIPYSRYQNKNGFNTMAALQQMLDAEEGTAA
ncbi:MAG: replication initiator protein A [Defluviitaleaceae bacterium]|nr:replication initiator protein A [Defluviitaleaceae bacterium]